MKMQTAPLLTIIVGLVIAAAGVFWHVHTVRTDSGAAPRSIAPRMEQQSKEEGTTAPDIAAKSTGGDSSMASDNTKTTSVGSQDVGRPPDRATQATTTPLETPNRELKSSTLEFANRIRTFEQSYDSRREQIVGGNQTDKEKQTLELKTLDAEKVNEFVTAFLPNAQYLQAELLRRLRQRGIEVAVPPPPGGISIALGRSLLQLDIRTAGLPGYRPVHGLASYLEMLASNLPD